ncbi:MAG: glycosyltransferase family 4 protein [Thermoguttaceae bacterium]|nr:glycosyltransferase family 4 protein [Thermoguttaceae bacterium]MDW8038419.1 glycosyltransferase family 4 protein [Thermoguttaceae bacterium]
MNIWILNHYAITPDLPGGTRHYDLGRHLAQNGHQITIFASSFHHYLHQEIRLGPGEKRKLHQVEGVWFLWLRTPPYERNDWRRVHNMIAFAFRAWRTGRRLPHLFPQLGKPDVVIGSSPHLLTPLAAYRIARHWRAAFVLELRDIWPEAAIELGLLNARHPAAKVLQLLSQFLYRKATRIISLLPCVQEHVRTYGGTVEKIVWIPNGVELAHLQAKGRTPGENGDGFCVMYVGAHGQANALDTVLQAAALVEQRGYSTIRFVLVGDGPEKARLQAMARQMQLGNVEFRDPVPKSQVFHLLQEADALLVQLGGTEVYRYGMSSNKLFDAMAAGKPVFSSADAPNNPVREAQCGFAIPPRNPEALAESIVHLYHLPASEREAMGRRAQAYIQQHHDIRKLAQRLEQTLWEVLQNQ